MLYKRWRLLCVVVSCVVVGLAVGGCGKPSSDIEPADRPAADTESAEGAEAAADADAPAAIEGEPVDGDWLVARLPAEMEHLNPFTSSDAYATTINSLVFERLVDRDNRTLEVKPYLAESWEISEDKLQYTFRIRQDVTFSDGKPLTGRDVKFSFDKLMDPATNAPHMRNYFQDVTACELVDDFTVRFTCNQPYFRHLVVLGALEIIPEHVYGEGDFNNHRNNRSPIGSGPYKLEKWETGLQVTLVRNEDYWREEPRILKRVYKIITNADAAFQVLNRQELDAMEMTAELWMERATGPEFEGKFNKVEYYEPSYSYVGWNLRRPQLGDKMVRRALTMLLDREEIRDEIYYGLARITTGNFFVDEPEYDKTIEPWPFDPDQAKKILDEAGWKDSDGDGIRDNDGTPLKFEVLLVNSSVTAEQIATIYQEELKRAGIEMTIRQLEWATFLESVKQQDYDACFLGWRLAPDPDPYQLWHSSQTVRNGSNSSGFVNEEADAIIEAGRLEFDRDKRIEMYHRFHAIVHEEQPYTFLFCPKTLEAVDKRFQNVEVYPYGLDPQEWWVPADQQRYK